MVIELKGLILMNKLEFLDNRLHGMSVHLYDGSAILYLVSCLKWMFFVQTVVSLVTDAIVTQSDD